MDKDYSKRELDEFFAVINRRFDSQDKKLDNIVIQTTTTNGKVAKAIRDIDENKSDVNQNWRAIQLATAIFITVIMPLIAIIYYNVTASVNDLKNEIQRNNYSSMQTK